MKNSKLWKLIRILDKKDIRELRKVVNSPYFNQRSDVAMLFETLIEHIKNPDKSISKEAVFEYIYPKTVYNAAQIHLISSLLYKNVEQYLILKEREQKVVEDRINLATAYRKLNLDDFFIRTIEEAKALHEAQKLRNAEYFETKYDLLIEELEYALKSRKIDENLLIDLSQNLDKSFLSRALRLELALLSHKAVANKSYNSGILKSMNVKHTYQDAAISLYETGYDAVITEDENTFNEFKLHIKEESHLFPVEEQKDLFLIAINFCIKKFNAGNEKYMQICLDLYKDGLNKNIFIENGKMSMFTYINIVLAGCMVKDWDWVEHFVHDHIALIEKNLQQGLYNFSMGRINYERKKFDSALKFLSLTDSKDILINLSAKALQSRIFYELAEYQVLQSHLNAFNIFIKRHSELGYHKISYLNFIKSLNQLLNLSFKNNKEVDKLELSVKEEQYIYEKKWLLEQIAMLKNKK